MYTLSKLALLGMVGQAFAYALPAPPLTVHPVIRNAGLRFENLNVRRNGQILTTTTTPNASVYQVDPLGILPPTLLYTVPGALSAGGISEGLPDVFYFVSFTNGFPKQPGLVNESAMGVWQLDLNGVAVLPNGTLSQPPKTKRVAALPHANLPNGAYMTRRGSDHMLVADSFVGIIWNVNIATGEVGIALNDTSTQGPVPQAAGINGLFVTDDGVAYWTNTGRSTLYRLLFNPDGTIPAGQIPHLVTTNLTCDDLTIDHEGNAYVAGPLDVLTKVTPDGAQRVLAGTRNSSESSLIGPTSVRFGRGIADRWSLYVTTNGGGVLGTPENATLAGVSRIDLADYAARPLSSFQSSSRLPLPWFLRWL